MNATNIDGNMNNLANPRAIKPLINLNLRQLLWFSRKVDKIIYKIRLINYYIWFIIFKYLKESQFDIFSVY